MTSRRLMGWTLIFVAVAAIALVVFVVSFDANRHRAEIQRQVSSALGREVVFLGKLEARLALRPLLVAERVIITNPDWASRTYFARASRLEFELDLLAMLRDEIILQGAQVIDADILFERHANGATNWSFGLGADTDSTVFDLGPTHFENLNLAYLSDDSEWSTQVKSADHTNMR